MRTRASWVTISIAISSVMAQAPAQISYTEVAAAVGLDMTPLSGPVFPEITANALLQKYFGYGAAVGDYDSDGDLDVYVLQGRTHPNRLYRNELAGGVSQFVDVTATAGAGLADLGSSRIAHFADLDNDGHLDLLLINEQNGAHQYPPSRVFSNDGDGTFTDRTSTAGFEPIGYTLCGTSLADYDQDGLLDIYVTVWTNRLAPVAGATQWIGSNRLYRNLGDFQFMDVTTQTGLAPLNMMGQPEPLRVDSFTSIFTDFTNDGLPDIYVAVDFLSDKFYVNTGGFFVDQTQASGLTHLGNDMGVACADVDNDRDLDLYVTNITDPWFDPCQFGTGMFNTLMLQDQPGALPHFSDQALQSGAYDTHWGWGTEFVDIDNDADLDIFAVNGMDDLMAGSAPCGMVGTPSYLFENDGSTHFTRVTPPAIHGHADDSRGLVAFDFDRDGDQDFLVTNYEQPLRLFRNDTPPTPTSGHWLDVSVRQVNGNRSGIGVEIDVRTSSSLRQRQVLLAGESFLVGTPAEAHFGLGAALEAEYVRAHWADGTATTILDVAADQHIVVQQPERLCDWDATLEITVADASAFAGDWDQSSPRCDLDGDENLDATDLAMFVDCWNLHAPPTRVGENYCTGAPNSAHAKGARLTADGSTSFQADNIVLHAERLPQRQITFFYHGTLQGMLPFGNGFRCTTGPTTQLPAQKSNVAGIASAILDLSGPAGQLIAPGVTRYFQCLYRDPDGGGANFNLTDGLSLKFLP